MEKLRIYQDIPRSSNFSQRNLYSSKSGNLRMDYSFCDQLRRAAISILANIAEGYMRSKKQFKNYLKISSGSANEVVALLQVVSAVYRIDTLKLQESFRLLGRKINALSKSF